MGFAIAVLAAGAVVHFADLRISDESAPATDAGSATALPDVTGTPVPIARHTLDDLGLSSRVRGAGWASLGFGPPPVVQGQDPPAGTSVSTGGSVTLYVRNR